MAVAVAAVAVAEVAGEPLRSARESGKFDAECSEGMANLDWWWGCLLLLSLGLNYHHLNSNDRQISLTEMFYRFFRPAVAAVVVQAWQQEPGRPAVEVGRQAGPCTSPCPPQPPSTAPDQAWHVAGQVPAAVGLELLPGGGLSLRLALVRRACPLGG